MRSAHRPGLLAVLALLLTGLAGCSTMSVDYDFDTEVDFQQLQTFTWIDTAPQYGQDTSGLVLKRIQNAIGGELAARNMRESAEQPDVLVAYHLGAKDKIQVTDWGYSYSSYYWGRGGQRIDVYSYTEGQLIIDLVDARTKELVWRGSGTKVINQGKKSPEELQAAIDEAVNKIMANFPPPGK
jgi:hypothetical protein